MINTNEDLINEAITHNQYKKTPISSGTYGDVSILTFNDSSKVIVKFLKHYNVEILDNEIKILNLIKDQCAEYFVCFITFGDYFGIPYMVFEYLEGYRNLDGINFFKLDKSIASQIIRQLYTGLRTMHKLGIVHNDIKPINIISNGHKIKYIDYGLSCINYQCPVDGTPFYMSPDKSVLYENHGTYSFIQGIQEDKITLDYSVMELHGITGIDNDNYITYLEQLNRIYPGNYISSDWLYVLILNPERLEEMVLTDDADIDIDTDTDTTIQD